MQERRCATCDIKEPVFSSLHTASCSECERKITKECATCRAVKPLSKYRVCTYGTGRERHCRDCARSGSRHRACHQCGEELVIAERATKYCARCKIIVRKKINEAYAEAKRLQALMKKSEKAFDSVIARFLRSAWR